MTNNGIGLSTNISDINIFLSAGANRVLVKPMNMCDFHSAMASVALSSTLTLTPL